MNRLRAIILLTLCLMQVGQLAAWARTVPVPSAVEKHSCCAGNADEDCGCHLHAPATPVSREIPNLPPARSHEQLLQTQWVRVDVDDFLQGISGQPQPHLELSWTHQPLLLHAGHSPLSVLHCTFQL